MSIDKKVIIRITTVPSSIDILLKGQLKFLSNYYRVIALSSSGPELDIVKNRECVEVKAISMKREISLFHDIFSLFKLIIYFFKIKPYIIHSNTPKSSLISMIAGYFTGVSHRIYNVTGLRFETEKGLKRSILIFMEKLTCIFATHIIAESTGVRQLLKSNNITKKNVSIIANGNINGIDFDYWNKNIYNQNELRKFYNFKPDSFIFIYVGRITKDKGILELVDSFIEITKTHANLILILLGDIDNQSSLSESHFTKLINLPNILHMGFKSDIREFLKISNCLILPSYREGFPNVILQAGAFGKPVIMTDVCGSDEYLFPFNGIKIRKKSSTDLLNSMKDMIINYNKYDSDEISLFVKNRFSQEYIHSKLLDFYNTL